MSDNYVITIARGYGSGGHSIGQQLSEDLDIPFYDRDLIYLASEESGINVNLFGKMDEKVKNNFFGLVTDKYDGGLIPPESGDFASNKNLFNYQAKIIRELSEKGPCVIVGRCADYILRDNPNLIRVFIWASLESRIKNIMALKPMLNEKEAEREIRKVDAHRNEYHKYYSGLDRNDLSNYDICLNSSVIGYKKCASIIENYINVKLDK